VGLLISTSSPAAAPNSLLYCYRALLAFFFGFAHQLCRWVIFLGFSPFCSAVESFSLWPTVEPVATTAAGPPSFLPHAPSCDIENTGPPTSTGRKNKSQRVCQRVCAVELGGEKIQKEKETPECYY
jgi:hypothetical protein